MLGQARAQRPAFGEVQVQAEVDRVGQALQALRLLDPQRAVGDACDRGEALRPRQAHDAGRNAGTQAEVVRAQRQRARHARGSLGWWIAPCPASLPIRYTGRCLTSSKMRPTYSPRMPIDSNCTPLKNIMPVTSVAQPGTLLP